KSFFDRRMEQNMSRDVYQDFFFPCPDGSAPSGETQRVTFGPFESVLRDIRIWMLYDRVAIESQGLMNDSPPDHAPSGLRDQASCLHFVPGSLSPQGVQPLVVQVPIWWKPISVKWFAVLVLLAVGLFSVVARMTTFIA